MLCRKNALVCAKQYVYSYILLCYMANNALTKGVKSVKIGFTPL